MAFINISTFHMNVCPFVAPIYIYIYIFVDDTSTTHFSHILSKVSYVIDNEQQRKNGDPGDSNRQSIIIYHIRQLWEQTNHSLSHTIIVEKRGTFIIVFFFFNILFPFLNSQYNFFSFSTSSLSPLFFSFTMHSL